MDKEKLRNFTIKNNLVNDLVTDILEDKYGNIWLGTISGVSKYGRVIFEVTDSDMVLPENNVPQFSMIPGSVCGSVPMVT